MAKKTGANLMKREQKGEAKKAEYAFQNAPRCTATSKRTRQRCKAPAVRGYNVCRFHGARGGAPKGKANGAWKHGYYSGTARAERLLVKLLLKNASGLRKRSGET
jgi:hypothetical protein